MSDKKHQIILRIKEREENQRVLDIKAWLEENNIEVHEWDVAMYMRTDYNKHILWFHTESDALLFRMRWG